MLPMTEDNRRFNIANNVRSSASIVISEREGERGRKHRDVTGNFACHGLTTKAVEHVEDLD